MTPSSKVNNESYKLIETLQYHTLLIGLNVFIEIILLFIASQIEISAVCLSLSILIDIWCLLLMFRRIWFKKYCNYCLKCTKPFWRCCGINRPELYDYNVNELARNNQFNPYSSGKIHNENDYYYDQTSVRQRSDSSTIRKSKTKRSTIWSKFSLSRNKSYKAQARDSSVNNELYQPLTQQYQWEI